MGLVIGTILHGMPIGRAFETYAILTVGDGLVSADPGGHHLDRLCPAAGARRCDGVDRYRAFHSTRPLSRRALATVAALMALFALVPGLPFLPFVLGASGLAISASGRLPGQ